MHFLHSQHRVLVLLAMTNQYCTAVSAMPRTDCGGLKLLHASFSLHFFQPAATAQPSSVSPISPGLSSGHSPQSSAHPGTHPSAQTSIQTSIQTSQTPTPLLGSHSHPENTSSWATTTPSPTLHPGTTAAVHPSATTLLSSTATPRLTVVSEATTQLHTSGGVSKVRGGG